MISLMFNSGKGGIEFLIGISICRVEKQCLCCLGRDVANGLCPCPPAAIQHMLCFVSAGQKEGIICNTHTSDLGESLFHS